MRIIPDPGPICPPSLFFLLVLSLLLFPASLFFSPAKSETADFSFSLSLPPHFAVAFLAAPPAGTKARGNVLVLADDVSTVLLHS